MTDKMARLQELINESKKIREDVKAETKRLEAEHLENKKAEYKNLCEILKPYFELCKGLQPYQGASYPNVFMAVDKDSKYEIRFENPAQSIGVRKGIHDGMNHWIGRFDIRNPYESSDRSLSRGEGNDFHKVYYLEDFMKVFDETILEENFAAMITDQLAKMAKETDDAYQDAKAKLESDKEM